MSDAPSDLQTVDSAMRPRRRPWFATALILNLLGLVALAFPSFVPALVVLVPLTVLIIPFAFIDGFLQRRRFPGQKNRLRLREILWIALLILTKRVGRAVCAFEFIIETFVQTTISMEPTFMPGDCVIVHKRTPLRRFDIVAIIEASPLSSAASSGSSRFLAKPWRSLMASSESTESRSTDPRVFVMFRIGECCAQTKESISTWRRRIFFPR